MSESHFTRGAGDASGESGGVYAFSADELQVIAERPRHRAVLTALWLHGPLRPLEIADHVVARRHQVSVADVTPDQRRHVSIDLHHYHLPRLEDAGLIEWEDDQVSLGLEDREAARNAILQLDASPAADEAWEAIDTLLRDGRRRRVVATLDEADGPLPLEDLATQVAAREADCAGDVPSGTVESIRTSLHHVHLPKLASVGVVEYDPATGTVDLDRLPVAYRAVTEADVEVASG